MFKNPFKIWHFNIQEALVAIRRCDAVKKLPGRRDVLKNVPESEQVASVMGVNAKEGLSNIRAAALVRIVISNCVDTFPPQQSYKTTFTAADVYYEILFASEISATQLADFIQMPMKLQRMALIILVAVVISNNSRIKAPIENQACFVLA